MNPPNRLSEPQPRPRSARDLLLLGLLLAVLFGALAGLRPLAPPSEGRYAEIPREMLESGDFITPRLNGIKYFEKPPLFYWLQAGSLKAFGGSEAALRVWPATMAGIGCMAVFLAGCTLRNRRTGWLAAGMLATSALWFGLSRQIVLDMTVSALLTVSLLSFIAAVNALDERKRARLLYLMYGAAALATLTKGLIGIVIPGMVVFIWLALTGRWRFLLQARLPSGLLLFLVIAAPWHWLAAKANPEFAQFYFVHEHFERFTSKVHDRYAPPWFFIPVLLGGLLPWLPLLPGALVQGAQRGWQQRTTDGVSLFLLIWAVTVFAFFSASSSKLVPYVLPCLPPLALLMAEWLDRGSNRLAIGISAALVGLLGITFALAASGAADIFLRNNGRALEMLALAAPALWPIAIAALTGAIIASVLLWRRQTMLAIAALAVATGLVWIEADAASGPFIERSAKPLALALKSRLRAGDDVIAYRDYLQDFTYYMGRPVGIVDWTGELAFGAKQEDVSAIMLHEDEFRRRWMSDRRVFAVTSFGEFEKFVRESGLTAHEIARTRRHILFANDAAKP